MIPLRESYNNLVELKKRETKYQKYEQVAYFLNLTNFLIEFGIYLNHIINGEKDSYLFYISVGS